VSPLVPLTLLAILAITGAISDLLSRKIPNWLTLLTLLVGIAFLFTAGSWSEVWPHLAHFAVALIVSMTLFAFGMWGGGDAKFYSALAIWFPLSNGPLLALSVAVAGVIVIVLLALWTRFRPRENWSKEVPYGVAIATGALATTLLVALRQSA